jgi:hypothetical protein
VLATAQYVKHVYGVLCSAGVPQEMTTFMPAYNASSSKKAAVNVLDLPMLFLARCAWLDAVACDCHESGQDP